MIYCFSEVISVTEGSPAWVSGLRPGDFLVKYQDDLAIFQSHQDIETNLKQINDLSLQLEIERGQLEPMVPNEAFEKKSQSKKNVDEGKFTIVLDKERGIYKYPNK